MKGSGLSIFFSFGIYAFGYRGFAVLRFVVQSSYSLGLSVFYGLGFMVQSFGDSHVVGNGGMDPRGSAP